MADETVLIRRDGRAGRITLNRPAALHALDLGMIRSIAGALADWRDHPAVHLVIVDAVPGKSFCAGGDIRRVRQHAMAGETAEIETFFREEYAMNGVIARYPKPFVALIDGICMGGGIGLAVHGQMRVATEAALFAMPETAIGFFPDVGASYLLPRLRGEWGTYMGLTGARIGGEQSAWIGLSTHFVRREELADLDRALALDGVSVLAQYALPPQGEPLDLAPFAAGSLPEIVAALAARSDAWAAETLATLRRMSPSALAWSLDLLRRGAEQTLEQCLDDELALTRRSTAHPDFQEGVRAMVVDKDRNPSWTPATIEALA